MPDNNKPSPAPSAKPPNLSVLKMQLRQRAAKAPTDSDLLGVVEAVKIPEKEAKAHFNKI